MKATFALKYDASTRYLLTVEEDADSVLCIEGMCEFWELGGLRDGALVDVTLSRDPMRGSRKIEFDSSEYIVMYDGRNVRVRDDCIYLLLAARRLIRKAGLVCAGTYYVKVEVEA